ncbi:MAG: threonine synthase, partial [Zoogloeaceae bacterium]|nr:threonine synthase [Zoogloeaceae bacterium]
LRDTPFLARLPGFAFASGKSAHADRLQTIRDVHAQYGLTIDPHTADGVKVALEYSQSREAGGVPLIVLETAQAAKFADTIQEALNHPPERPAELAGIEDLPQKVDGLAPETAAIKAYIAARVS